jgi:hypothetical protein
VGTKGPPGPLILRRHFPQANKRNLVASSNKKEKSAELENVSPSAPFFVSPVVENLTGSLCVPKRAPLTAPNSGMRHRGGGGGGGGEGGGPRRRAGRELHFEAVLCVDCSPCRHAYVLWRPCQCHVKPEKEGEGGRFGVREGEKELR